MYSNGTTSRESGSRNDDHNCAGRKSKRVKTIYGKDSDCGICDFLDLPVLVCAASGIEFSKYRAPTDPCHTATVGNLLGNCSRECDSNHFFGTARSSHSNRYSESDSNCGNHKAR